MPVVSASFRRAAGTVCSPAPGPVSSHPPGPVSSGVHTCEDQRDKQNDDEHEQPSTGEAGEATGKPPWGERDTGQHYLAPPRSHRVARPTVSRYVFEYLTVYLLAGSPPMALRSYMASTFGMISSFSRLRSSSVFETGTSWNGGQMSSIVSPASFSRLRLSVTCATVPTSRLVALPRGV